MEGAGLYLDSEGTAAAMLSALVLLSAAIGAVLFALAERRRGEEVIAPLGLGVFFLYMAADELLGLHERYDIWFGAEGLPAYVPLLLTGFLLWAKTRMQLEGLALHLFGLAAATWVGSQVLELIANPPGMTGVARGQLIYPEELAEAAGSGLFTLALFTAAGVSFAMPRVRMARERRRLALPAVAGSRPMG